MQVDTNGFELGDVVKHAVTGLEGTITGIHQYMTGCARATIQQKVGADGKVPDGYGVDVLELEMVAPGPRHEVQPATSKSGGPRNDPHSRR